MPSPRDVVIRDLRSADAAPAIEILAEAFLDFPAMQVFAGTDSGARERLERMFAMEFERDAHVSALGAELDGRLVGALTYLDSPVCSAISAGRTFRFMRLAGPRIVRTMRMFGRIERVHPKAPHRHLPSVGVTPALQAEGIGRRLMQEFDARCDRAGKTAYLETIRWSDPSRPSHERFYGRLGYAVSDIVPMTDEWSVLTMLRLPVASDG